MRHNKKVNHLGRTKAHREAMFANMASSLIKHKRIFTTTAKTKALRKYVEPLITKSKEVTDHSQRVVFASLQDKYAMKILFTAMISSRLELNLCLMCMSDVPIPVWIRLRLVCFNDSAAISMSFFTARISTHITGQVTALEISTTELKSPGLDTGNPASITSTPSSSRALATWIFSMVFS